MQRSSGQPTKLSDDVQDRICELARDGLPQQLICDVVGINRSTLTHWLRWGDPDWQPQDGAYCPKDRTRYLRFFTAFHEARSHPILLCEQTWLAAVRAGDARAAQRWLAKHHPHLYNDDLQHHTEQQANAQASVLDALKQYNEAFHKIGSELER